MNKDAVSDADVASFRATQGGCGDGPVITPFQGQELREEAPAGPLRGANPEDAPRTGVGARGQSGDDWGDPRVSGALRQPSRCLLTQKGCRHGANLPHGRGAWTGMETGEQGPKGVSGL